MENLINKLKENNFQAFYANNCEEAKDIALGLIPNGALIGMGNSQTLRETGIFNEITSGKYKVLNQFKEGLSREENLKIRRESILSDVYFTSTNAITENGELFNIDGKGNRVAAMMYGPEKVIVVAGKNKIVKNIDSAWERLKDYASPLLAKKLGRKTPCAKTVKCIECNSPQRICRYYTIIKSQMPDDKNRINIIIVDEDLGI